MSATNSPKMIEKQVPKCMDIYGAIKLAQDRDEWIVFVNIVNELK